MLIRFLKPRQASPKYCPTVGRGPPLPDFKETRARLVTETDPSQVVEILDAIAERWGGVPLADETGVYGI